MRIARLQHDLRFGLKAYTSLGRRSMVSSVLCGITTENTKYFQYTYSSSPGSLICLGRQKLYPDKRPHTAKE